MEQPEEHWQQWRKPNSSSSRAASVTRPVVWTAIAAADVFDRLHQQRDQFEAAYGRVLRWDQLEGRKACRIFEERPADVGNNAEHGEYLDFFMDGAVRFRKAIAAVEVG